jgi:HEPN domain-containing protein
MRLDPRGSPDDPREWLRQARDELTLAGAEVPGVSAMEPFCFHAQQAAEKAIKAVLLHRRIRFPFVHDLDRLLTLLADHGVEIPEAVREADQLTDYAVLTRYPFAGEAVDAAQRQDAVRIASSVLDWADRVVDI